MRCPQCQHENPELNRFCGMCGSHLEPEAPTAENAKPQEAETYHEAPLPAAPPAGRPFIVSTTPMGEVTSPLSNTRVVPPLSRASSTNVNYSRPVAPDHDLAREEEERAAAEEAARAAQIEQEERLRAEARDAEARREHAEAVARERHETLRPAGSGSILGLTPPVEEQYEPVEEVREVAPEPEMRNPYLHIEEPREERAERVQQVSGPSFLGLGGDGSSQDYLLEDEEAKPRGGRFLLVLVVLAIVGVLGFMEWRASSRGESTNPVDVLHLKLPKKKGQGEVVVLPPSANTASKEPTGAADSNSKPELIAEPNQAGAQNNNAGNAAAQSNPTTSASQPAEINLTPGADPKAAANSTPPPAPDATKTPTASESAAQTTLPTPKASPPPQVAKNTTPPVAKPAPTKATPTETANAKPSAKRPIATATPPATADDIDASLNAGAFELQRGKTAGATEEGRMWLWKAVSKGNGEAPILLADMYLQGRGVAKDCEQAILLLNAAAKKANPRARSKLGSMYAAGECVAQDRVQAYKWMTMALQANPGSEWIEKNRQTLLSQMTPGERRRAEAIH